MIPYESLRARAIIDRSSTPWTRPRQRTDPVADGHGRQHAFFEVFIAWAKANDIKFTCELWETYTVGPEVGDESKYRTEFVLRLGLARV